MTGIALSPRLSAAASFIQKNSRVADIGTDHGYLPIYLAKNNLASFILATDVKQAPLSSAVKNAKAHGVEDKIEFRLTNGLSGAGIYDLNTVVIAGMGGENIASILASDPWAIKKGMTLVLQPQSKITELSDFLTSNGVFVTDALLARDAGRIYLIYKATASADNNPTEAEKYAPRPLFLNKDMLLPEYLQKLIGKLSRAIAGMEKAGLKSPDTKLYEALRGLREMKDECDKWQR